MPTLSEAKKLVGAWAKDPVTGRRVDSIRYHFDLHGGTEIWAYLRDAMQTLAPASEIDEIQIAAKSMQTAFPYADCQKLAQASGVDYQKLVSDLDTYFYDVWSPGHGVKKLSQKPTSWLCDLQADLQKSFFECYPQYAVLEAFINLEDMPSLARRLAAADTLRQKLIIYLSELL